MADENKKLIVPPFNKKDIEKIAQGQAKEVVSKSYSYIINGVIKFADFDESMLDLIFTNTQAPNFKIGDSTIETITNLIDSLLERKNYLEVIFYNGDDSRISYGSFYKYTDDTLRIYDELNATEYAGLTIDSLTITVIDLEGNVTIYEE